MRGTILLIFVFSFGGWVGMNNIVICCDGTSNDIAGAPTNVLRFYRSLERNDKQLAYYDSGVGTLDDPSMLTNPGKAIGRKLDMAVGYSVKRQVCDCLLYTSPSPRD